MVLLWYLVSFAMHQALYCCCIIHRVVLSFLITLFLILVGYPVLRYNYPLVYVLYLAVMDGEHATPQQPDELARQQLASSTTTTAVVSESVEHVEGRSTTRRRNPAGDPAADNGPLQVKATSYYLGIEDYMNSSVRH